MGFPGESDGWEGDVPLSEEEQADATSPQAYREALKEQHRQRTAAKLFWEGVFSTEEGRAEMWRILSEAHTFETRFACSPAGFAQPEATWFHAGEQAFGLRLYHSWLSLAPVSVLRMHQENDNNFAAPTKVRRVSADITLGDEE